MRMGSDGSVKKPNSLFIVNVCPNLSFVIEILKVAGALRSAIITSLELNFFTVISSAAIKGTIRNVRRNITKNLFFIIFIIVSCLKALLELIFWNLIQVKLYSFRHFIKVRFIKIF